MAFGLSSARFERIAEGLYRVHFDLGFRDTTFSRGFEKLAFEVIFCLLTTQGSIPDDPEFGTHLRAYVGQLMVNHPEGAAAILGNEAIKAESQVKARQATRELLPDEKLESLTIDEVIVDPETQSAEIRLFIVNSLGQSVGFAIPA